MAQLLPACISSRAAAAAPPAADAGGPGDGDAGASAGAAAASGPTKRARTGGRAPAPFPPPPPAARGTRSGAAAAPPRRNYSCVALVLSLSLPLTLPALLRAPSHSETGLAGAAHPFGRDVFIPPEEPRRSGRASARAPRSYAHGGAPPPQASAGGGGDDGDASPADDDDDSEGEGRWGGGGGKTRGGARARAASRAGGGGGGVATRGGAPRAARRRGAAAVDDSDSEGEDTQTETEEEEGEEGGASRKKPSKPKAKKGAPPLRHVPLLPGGWPVGGGARPLPAAFAPDGGADDDADAEAAALAAEEEGGGGGGDGGGGDGGDGDGGAPDASNAPAPTPTATDADGGDDGGGDDAGAAGGGGNGHGGEPWVDVDRVLGVRRVAGSRPTYCVKQSGRSFRDLAWVSEAWLKANATGKLRGFRGRSGREGLDDGLGDDPAEKAALTQEAQLEDERAAAAFTPAGVFFPISYLHADRVIAVRRAPRSGPDGPRQFLVKWKGLGYSHATWEDESSLCAESNPLREEDAAAVERYGVVSSPRAPIPQQPAPQPKHGEGLVPPPDFKPGCSLRDYQLDSFDWLARNLRTRRNVILGDESACVLGCIPQPKFRS